MIQLDSNDFMIKNSISSGWKLIIMRAAGLAILAAVMVSFGRQLSSTSKRKR